MEQPKKEQGTDFGTEGVHFIGKVLEKEKVSNILLYESESNQSLTSLVESSLPTMNQWIWLDNYFMTRKDKL